MPLEGAKYHASLGARAPAGVTTAVEVVGVDGGGDEAGEPEDHAYALEGHDGEFVRGGRPVAGGQGEVGKDGEDGPDRTEKEEVEL